MFFVNCFILLFIQINKIEVAVCDCKIEYQYASSIYYLFLKGVYCRYQILPLGNTMSKSMFDTAF